MTQLIINGLEYPTVSNDNYKCFPEDKSETIRMADGTLVHEIAYSYMVIEYSYDYPGDEFIRQCLADLHSGKTLDVMYLTPESDELNSGIFVCTKQPAPTYAFDGKWHNISFRLEGGGGLA